MIGRHTELASFHRLAAGSAAVCIWGPAGVGKSHFMRALASELGTGAVLIDLADITSAEGMLAATATKLGISCAPDRSCEDILDNVAGALARRSAVLLLDGVEDMQAVHHVVQRLLALSPRPRVAVAGRVAMREAALLKLTGLTPPDAATLAQELAMHAAAELSDDAKLLALRLAAGNPAALELLVGTAAVIGSPRFVEAIEALPLSVWARRNNAQFDEAQQLAGDTVDVVLDAVTSIIDEDAVLAVAELATFAAAYMPVFLENDATSASEARATARRCGLLQHQQDRWLVPTYVRGFLDSWSEQHGLRGELWLRHSNWVCARLAPIAAAASTDLAARQELRQAGADLVLVIRRFDGQGPAARAAFLLHPLLFLRGPYEISMLEFDRAVAMARPHRGKDLALALVRRATNIRHRALPSQSIRDLSEALAAYPGAPYHLRYRIHVGLATLQTEVGDLAMARHHMQVAADIVRDGGTGTHDVDLRADLESLAVYVASSAGDFDAAKLHALAAAQNIRRNPELVAEARQILGEVGALQFARKPLYEREIDPLHSQIEFLAHIGLDALPELDGIELDTPSSTTSPPPMPTLESAQALLDSMTAPQWQAGVALITVCCAVAEARRTAAAGDEYRAEAHRSAARRRFALITRDASVSLGAHIATSRRLWPLIVPAELENLPAQLVIAADAAWFARSGWPRVDMRRRRLLRRLLQTLVHQRLSDPAKPVTTRAMLEAAWPGEMIADQYLTNRLYVAISTMRDLGLGERLETVEGGYRLYYGKELQIVPATP
ncbi:MAG: ATP-binding protein [Myxococcales bacterium]|nr:ATP-binding protein [Myxococcales bacterium]